MGEVAGAGLLAHVPTIMLPYEQRLELNEGKEISLVTGLQRLRAEIFEALDYDTVVVLDSHWHTTPACVGGVLHAPSPCRLPPPSRPGSARAVARQARPPGRLAPNFMNCASGGQARCASTLPPSQVTPTCR